ncbi:MAG: peptidoglycan-binding protein, partial [Rhodobacteraceae bacterium]|nr:peptidoglycan-binding protein [Paracoccaceae bacterium]
EIAADTGMPPDELGGTALVCLGVGYRAEAPGTVLGAALVLVGLDTPVYGEVVGHHLALGLGVPTEPVLASQWYDSALDALEAGADPAFLPMMATRPALLRAQTGRLDNGPSKAAGGSGDGGKLPSFGITK